MVYLDRENLSALERIQTEGSMDIGKRNFIILYAQQLIEKKDNTIVLSGRGRELLEIWCKCKDFPGDPWLDSRVYTLLMLLKYLNGKVPEPWREVLDERFAVENGRVQEFVYKLLDILHNVKSRILITQDFAEKILEVPDGPVPVSQIDPELASILEAENMLVRSLFKGRYVALTPLGRLVREILKRVNIGTHEIVLSSEIIELVKALRYKREEVPREVVEYLADLGYADAEGYLTKAGKLLLELEELSSREYCFDKIFVLTEPEKKVLYTVADLEERSSKSGSIEVTRDVVEKELKDSWGYRAYSIGLVINELKASKLVSEEESRGKTLVKLTDRGRRVVDSKLGVVSASTCKVLTFVFSYASPDEEWINEAKNEGLVGTRGFTSIADTVRELAKDAVRPFLTEIEVKILRKIPENGYIKLGDLCSELEERISVEKLEEKGLVKVLPGDVVILTDEGKVMKEALIGVPSGIAAPVTYELVKVLEVVKSRKTEDLVTLVRETGLDLDTVKTVLTIARACKFLGRASLTELGEKLLSALSSLKSKGFLEF